jgi:threonine dehydrogenase-like Zn-dependent dehydrogenase
MALDDAPHAYELFKHKQDQCVKVVLHPGQQGTMH